MIGLVRALQRRATPGTSRQIIAATVLGAHRHAGVRRGNLRDLAIIALFLAPASGQSFTVRVACGEVTHTCRAHSLVKCSRQKRTASLRHVFGVVS
jgi:hypothetical protein